MTMHPTPAERLLSILEEDSAMEALPANEVRAELTAFGVDPARSIAFAKSLAREGGSPGGRLMMALLAAEDEDEEIARIEAADIADVRGRIHHGAAAAIAAEARRKAGLDDNVIGLAEKRRKRRRLIVWGGPLAGIAASFLVVAIFMGNAFLSKQRMNIKSDIEAKMAEAPAPAMPDPALEGYARPGPDGSLADEILALNAPREPAPETQSKEKNFADSDAEAPAGDKLAFNDSKPAPPALESKRIAPAETEQRLRKQESFALAPEPESAPPLPRPAKKPTAESDAVDSQDDVAANSGQVGITSRTTGVAESPTLPVIVAPRESLLAEEESEEAEVAAAPPVAGQAPAVGILRSAAPSEIIAVLVIDPSRAPLQIQSPILPPDGLENRLDEARRLAGDRPVIALYTIVTGSVRQDFAQVPLRPGQPRQMVTPAPLVGLLGVEAAEYDFIALPAK